MLDIRKANKVGNVYSLNYHDVFITYTKSKGKSEHPENDWFIIGLTLYVFGERVHKNNATFANKMQLSVAQKLIDDTIQLKFKTLFGAEIKL